MRKALLIGLAAATLAIAPAQAQNLTSFFRNANLVPLAQSPMVLNLVAQSTSKTPQANVNAYNDFYLINGPGKRAVRFNANLQNLGQAPLPGWIGVLQYPNHEILTDIQFGFQQVKAHYNIPNARAARVTVYKTINTHQLVYDYVVQTSSPVSCREYLYTPATGGYQLGMVTRCYFTLPTALGQTSAGQAP
ncbi:MAG: hypothetical protein QOF14_2149 [Hyphomicrobiales bacterium]|jgi:hypothetical protein|nr:hypothetical protein [Hyphomicrobiales bacterium]